MSDQTQEETEETPWAEEEKRLRAIRKRRQDEGKCVLCGKPLGFFDKLGKRTQHKTCENFKE